MFSIIVHFHIVENFSPTPTVQLLFEQNYQNHWNNLISFWLSLGRMFKDLLNEPLVCAVLGLLLGFALGLCYANCFAQPRGEQRPRQRAARGELKMVLLVRTDLGMQKGTFCSKMFSFCQKKQSFWLVYCSPLRLKDRTYNRRYKTGNGYKQKTLSICHRK